MSSSTSIDGNFTVESGTIYQGDITTEDRSAVISFIGTFDGVTLDGTLLVADEFEAIIVNGLTLNGTIELGDTQDASATLIFDDTASAQTLSEPAPSCSAATINQQASSAPTKSWWVAR